jgi:outer membrane lipoprotein carrier protein
MKNLLAALLFFVSVFFASNQAHADAVDTLKEFVRDVKSGRSTFTQTVTAPDGAKKRSSSGSFEFLRPNRFRFVYAKPLEQTIVSDGQKVWIYDADLNQVSIRKFSAVLGATPAALLAGGSLDKDFDVSNQPSEGGMEWVLALPKVKDGAFQSVRIGFKAKTLAAVEITDSFGQRSNLVFSQMQSNLPIAADSFKFTTPPGADVIEQ